MVVNPPLVVQLADVTYGFVGFGFAVVCAVWYYFLVCWYSSCEFCGCMSFHIVGIARDVVADIMLFFFVTVFVSRFTIVVSCC